MSSIFDDASAISIKAAFGDNIVAFRTDRGATLQEVRDKLHHKLVNQQNLKLSENFVLMYKPNVPSGPGSRPGTAGGPGRAQSGSVSSINSPSDSAPLRLLLTQNEWQNAVNAAGTKIVLHIINA